MSINKIVLYKFMNNNKAFSLIELMLVVAITAAISAIAIPNYKEYINKAKVSAMISAIDPCQTQIFQYFLKNGSLPDGISAGQPVTCQGQTLGAAPMQIADKIFVTYTYSANISQFTITHSDLHPSGSSTLYQIYVKLDASSGDIAYSCGTFTANPLPAALLPPSTCTGSAI